MNSGSQTVQDSAELQPLWLSLFEFAIKKKFSRLVKKILRCPGVDLQRVPDVLLSVWAVLDIVECRIYRKFRFAAELIDIVCSSEAKILTQKDLVTLLTYLRLVDILAQIGTEDKLILCEAAKTTFNIKNFTQTKNLKPTVLASLKSSLNDYLLYTLKILVTEECIEQFLSKTFEERLGHFESKIFQLTNLFYDTVTFLCCMTDGFEQLISGEQLPCVSDGENRLLQELFLARLTQLGSNPTEADLMGLLDENWDCASQATVGIPPELSFTPTSDTSTEEMVRSTTSSDKSIGSLEPASLTPISVAKNVVKFDALAEVNSKIVYDTPKKKRKLRSDSTNGENDNWILQAIESHKCFVVLTRLTPSKMRFLSLTS